MAARGATKGVSLVKQAWHEIPEIVCTLGLCGAGLAFGTIASIAWLRDPEAAHQHKYKYTVVRTSDVDPNKKIYN